MIQMNLQNRKRLIDLKNKLMVASGQNRERDRQEVRDGQAHTAIFKMDNQQGPTVQHMELCSMVCGSLDRRSLGRMDTCICMAESLRCSPETITTLFVNQLYHNTKLKVLKIKRNKLMKGVEEHSRTFHSREVHMQRAVM